MKIFLIAMCWFVSLSSFSQARSKSGHVKFRLEKVSVSGDTLSFESIIFNWSQLGYTPLYIQFFIRDRHIATRTAVQENELQPLRTSPLQMIPAKNSMEFIFRFKQFTIPATKELVIVLKERNGSRDMTLHIRGRKLLRMIKNTRE